MVTRPRSERIHRTSSYVRLEEGSFALDKQGISDWDPSFEEAINPTAWIEDEHRSPAASDFSMPLHDPEYVGIGGQYWEPEELTAAIAASREMLLWPDDWDGEGSPRYDEATWLRATSFLRESAESLWDDFGVTIEIPRVLPGPNGSIDLHWRTGAHELLVNFPADPVAPVAFYGDDSAGNVIKGELAGPAQKRWLLLWLAE